MYTSQPKKNQKNTRYHIGCAGILAVIVMFGAPKHASAAIGAFLQPLLGNHSGEITLPYSVYAAGIGDLGNDGLDEILVSATDGKMHALRGDGSEIFTMATPDGGAGSVAIADDSGDGIGDIIVGSAPGGGSVSVYSGGRLHRLFSPYGDFKGGIDVASADVDGDGVLELVTIPLSGGSSHLRVWNRNGSLRAEKIVFDIAYDQGSHVAAGDRDGDGRDEIMVTKRVGSGDVSVFDGQSLEREMSFTAIGKGFAGGLRIAVADVSNDGNAEIIVVPESGGGPHVHVFSGEGKTVAAMFSREETYRGATLLAVGLFARVAGMEQAQLLAISGESTIPRADLAKQIIVDYSEQRLYAYEHGALVKSFLVSTGKNKTTPMGQFEITAKPYIVHYAGPGYDMGRIPYNLRFQPHIYVHYAPWHNNFGQPYSRGCVNVNLESAKWIYGWADVGTPIAVVD